jgi:hypothetical protein
MQENKKIRACTFQQEILVNIEEKLSIFHVQRTLIRTEASREDILLYL